MNKNKLKIYVTSKDDSSKRISLSPIEELSKDTANIKSKITIEPKNQRQEILGFGGSFTEASSRRSFCKGCLLYTSPSPRD